MANLPLFVTRINTWEVSPLFTASSAGLTSKTVSVTGILVLPDRQPAKSTDDRRIRMTVALGSISSSQMLAVTCHYLLKLPFTGLKYQRAFAVHSDGFTIDRLCLSCYLYPFPDGRGHIPPFIKNG